MKRSRPAPDKSKRKTTRSKTESLSRPRVIEAAIVMVDRDGADALSIRALAGELGVTPMALYNHVSNKRDLLASVAQRILADARFDHGKTEWRPQIEACFGTLREICIRHPGVARLVEIEGVAPNAVFAPMKVTLSALSRAGLDPTDAMCAYFTLVSFTLAQAGYQTRGPFPDLEPLQAILVNGLTDRLAKTIAMTNTPSTPWDFDRAFQYGLTLILDGIDKAIESRGDL
ncbi:MAG: TetR/AcrR family transcriptional regulator C-terminal domain-containing protein [Pseudomonadota bacterium]|nr:TetR/AcrR family transcriptional regulator C-terminal domain-containing protein [Pseudomonadota bacterium]